MEIVKDKDGSNKIVLSDYNCLKVFSTLRPFHGVYEKSNFYRFMGKNKDYSDKGSFFVAYRYQEVKDSFTYTEGFYFDNRVVLFATKGHKKEYAIEFKNYNNIRVKVVKFIDTTYDHGKIITKEGAYLIVYQDKNHYDVYDFIKDGKGNYQLDESKGKVDNNLKNQTLNIFEIQMKKLEDRCNKSFTEKLKRILTGIYDSKEFEKEKLVAESVKKTLDEKYDY